ncbi:helix-turn-helix domain-containing protein [Streptococcus intermedius]|uniref:Exoenzyme S synthesis regulatory protein ExsA n=1 Tax=Streptococcus intermedius TaxID=1338 RepID=A0AAE8G249_STRIT|nr:AraC family transcriptional regulator [Streptococcus intermedius]EID82649.1 DNA-binding helix-turn-helix protein [Streptococcus intermedius SK54 = ATCC 27335]EPH04540.1 hypothetical protein HMPREF1654_00677 [Streptococcus intermedius SK54 = ATCC 27335]MDK8091503.1 AraC family transcriptional regulator [Streptococcus intermedius]RSJ23114.1 Exoenzyme S synthesis regulatory protein ExsA [Streptococcus intermedius]SQH51165.1 AraC family transcriptional regulator [Streptococcus intermedius]
MKEIDYSQWKMNLFYEDENKKIYIDTASEEKYIVYKLFSGIEVMYCNFVNNEQWSVPAIFEVPKYFQIAYSHNGALQLELNKGKTVWCDPGDLYIFHDVNRRYYSEVLTTDFHGFHLIITPETIDSETSAYFLKYFDLNVADLYKKIQTMKPVLKLKSFDNAIHICEELYENILEEMIGVIRVKTIELLLLLYETNINQVHIYRNFTKETIEKTRMAKAYIDANLEKNITVEYLCITFDLTLTLFKNCFKELYQHAPYEYCLKARMTKAAELLEHTNNDILSIALEVGYVNSSSFARAFRKVYHTSPSRFRENKLFTKFQ